MKTNYLLLFALEEGDVVEDVLGQFGASRSVVLTWDRASPLLLGAAVHHNLLKAGHTVGAFGVRGPGRCGRLASCAVWWRRVEEGGSEWGEGGWWRIWGEWWKVGWWCIVGYTDTCNDNLQIVSIRKCGNYMNFEIYFTSILLYIYLMNLLELVWNYKFYNYWITIQNSHNIANRKYAECCYRDG